MTTQTAEQSAFIAEVVGGTTSINLNAVAGSGKTTTLVSAINALAPKPGQVMALAFNKKIAAELQKRLPPQVDCLTLSSLGYRAWQQRIGKKLTLNDKKIGELCSKALAGQDRDSWVPLKDLCNRAKDLGLVPQSPITTAFFPLVADTMENWLEIVANFSIEGGEDLISKARSVLVESIGQAMRGEIDFADMLYMPCVTRARLPQYAIVFIDEAQDLSEIQHELISRCVQAQGRIIAVGDPRQAIYGFRGAHNNSMAVLKARFGSKEMGLTCSFRCPQTVIKQAQRIVPHIRPWDEAPQGLISRWDKDWSPETLKSPATVLCRNVAPLIKLGFDCFKAGVSCWVVGRDLGAPISKAAKELEGASPKALHDSVRAWKAQKTILANNNLEIISKVDDTAEALHFVIEASEATSPGDIIHKLGQLFSRDSGSLTLSTIHRAKGLEWDIVYFLDEWRIPAKYVQRAGVDWMLEQEENLRYIAYTRAKKELHFINYEEYR